MAVELSGQCKMYIQSDSYHETICLSVVLVHVSILPNLFGLICLNALNPIKDILYEYCFTDTYTDVDAI